MRDRSPYLLLAAVTLLVVGALAGYFIPRLLEEREPGPPATTPRVELPAETTTTEREQEPAPLDEGPWREVVVPYEGQVWEVRVSDELLVLIGDDEAVAYLPAEDALVTLAEATPVYAAAVEGRQVVLWEAVGQESGQFVSLTVPEAERIVLPDPGPLAAWPALAGGFLTWVEPSYEEHPALQRLTIYGVPLTEEGLPADISTTLVEEVLELVEGDTFWDYAFRPPYLAFEHHRSDGGREAGLYLLSGEGEEILVDPDGHSAWLTDDTLYWHSRAADEVPASVRSYDLETGEEAEVATPGEWPAAGPGYVAYLRPTGSAAGAEAYQVVVREADGSESILVDSTAASPVRQTLYASANYLAFAEDGNVRLFARGDAPGRGLAETGGPGPGEQTPDATLAPTGPSVTVPDVSGLYPDEARTALEEAGLRVQVDNVYGPTDEDAGEIGFVYRQSPEPGARVPQGTVVRLRAWFETQ
jgi:hypothetical protein